MKHFLSWDILLRAPRAFLGLSMARASPCSSVNIAEDRCLVAGIIHAMGHGEPSAKWYGQQAVYRVSMGNFVSSFHITPKPLTCWRTYAVLSAAVQYCLIASTRREPRVNLYCVLCSFSSGLCHWQWWASSTKVTRGISTCSTVVGC